MRAIAAWTASREPPTVRFASRFRASLAAHHRRRAEECRLADQEHGGDGQVHSKEKKIDQLHVAATCRIIARRSSRCRTVAKGMYFDLGAANATGDYDKLMTDLSKAVWKSLPERPENKPVVSGAAPMPVLPPVGPVKLARALPPGEEPEEPKIEKPASSVATEAPEASPVSKMRGIFASVGWAITVVVLVCGAMFLGPERRSFPAKFPRLGAGFRQLWCRR